MGHGEAGGPSPAPRTTTGRTARRRGPSGRSAFVIAVMVVAAGLFAAAWFRIPYYSLAPGSIRSTEPLIELGGGVADPDAGEVAFATVSVEGRLNLLQALSGWWDPTIDVVPEDRILQGRSPQDNEVANRVMMDDSKGVAVQLALQRLGLSVPAGAEVATLLDAGTAAGGDSSGLAVGDVIVSVAGQPVDEAADVVSAANLTPPGGPLDIEVVRGGFPTGDAPPASRQAMTITLGRGGGDSSVPLLPVALRNAFDVSYPGAVSIDSGQVGGPSAGLAFTLGIIDLLTDGDLTGGERVAATGTIDAAGNIGPIGGLPQKAAAARRAGITVFLVPDSVPTVDLDGARDLGEGVEIVPVGTLDDALRQLADHGGQELALPAMTR